MLSEITDRLNDLIAQEEAIEEDTGELQSDIRQRRISAIRETLPEFIEEARERVAQMQEELNSADQAVDRPSVERDFSSTRELLDSLDRSLEAENIEGSLEEAQALQTPLANASWQLEREIRRGGERGDAAEEALESVAEIEGEAEALAEELEELIRQARPIPGEGDQPRLDEIAESQRTAGESLEELEELLELMGEEMPMISDEFGPPLRRAGGFMEDASEQLGQGQLPGAWENEQSALRSLRQMGQQVGQMAGRERMRRRRESGFPQQERVEIPEEADETPAEFREDLMEAMREDGLEAYQQAIRRYYESLVE
jgi:HPt (histidine-containing phosphotransfer) domain-containing protein